MNIIDKKKLRSYVINIYSKSNLRIEIFINITRQNYKHSGKKKKRKIEKNKRITIIILTKNNDIYNARIVTGGDKAIYVFMD